MHYIVAIYVARFIKTGPNRTRNNFILTYKLYTLALPRHTKQMAKDGQVYFHKAFCQPGL